MNKLGIAATIALVATSPALAQESTGSHVEAHLGWDNLAVPDQTGQTTGQSPSSRLLYGFGAGYDISLGHSLIVGIDSNFDLGAGSNCTGSVLSSGDSLCGKMKRDWDIGARLGVKAGPGLIYGRVAYDNSLVGSTYLPAGGTATTASNSYGGLRLGLGAEMPVAGPAYLKAEYRYTVASGLPDQNQVLAGIGIHF